MDQVDLVDLSVDCFLLPESVSTDFVLTDLLSSVFFWEDLSEFLDLSA
jgi:hypothetical protein